MRSGFHSRGIFQLLHGVFKFLNAKNDADSYLSCRDIMGVDARRWSEEARLEFATKDTEGCCGGDKEQCLVNGVEHVASEMPRKDLEIAAQRSTSISIKHPVFPLTDSISQSSTLPHPSNTETYHATCSPFPAKTQPSQATPSTHPKTPAQESSPVPQTCSPPS